MYRSANEVPKSIIEFIAFCNYYNPYAKITSSMLEFTYPEVNYPSFLPQKGECIIYATPAYTYKDKKETLGY